MMKESKEIQSILWLMFHPTVSGGWRSCALTDNGLRYEYLEGEGRTAQAALNAMFGEGHTVTISKHGSGWAAVHCTSCDMWRRFAEGRTIAEALKSLYRTPYVNFHHDTFKSYSSTAAVWSRIDTVVGH